jgi:hypothetical protein
VIIHHNNNHSIDNREDFRHGFKNIRPVFAKMNTEYEDSEEYDRFLDLCAAEGAANKTDMNWYACVAQKPLY